MFWKKSHNKKSGKHFPRSVVKQQAPVTTKEVAKKLASISTVSYADVLAVFAELPGVLADFMAAGRSVHIDNFGTLRYVGYADSVDTAEEVSAKLFRGVRVRFLPETTYSGADGSATRAIISDDLQWIEVSADTQDASDTTDDDTTTSGGSGDSGTFD